MCSACSDARMGLAAWARARKETSIHPSGNGNRVSVLHLASRWKIRAFEMERGHLKGHPYWGLPELRLQNEGIALPVTELGVTLSCSAPRIPL